ncbi:hypothetical protein ACTFIY_005387 [Dictyostelium cf. discoideum]
MKDSAILNQLKVVLPPHIMEIIYFRYNQIDTYLKPYNLPIKTDFLLLALFTLIFIIIISKLFGSSGNKTRSVGGRTSNDKKVKRGVNIAILGLSNAGKTALLLNLTNVDKKISTHTSITTNNGVYITENKKKLPIIDVPGNGKAKASLPKILSNSACIIYVIDGTTFIDNSTQEAQYLYDILTNESVYQKKIPVLVFNNKMDLDSTIDTEQVKNILERELDDLRRTRGATPIVLGQEEDKKDIYLGIEGTAFQFDHLPNDVQFSNGSASPSNGELKEIDDIKNFIQTTTQ